MTHLDDSTGSFISHKTTSTFWAANAQHLGCPRRGVPSRPAVPQLHANPSDSPDTSTAAPRRAGGGFLRQQRTLPAYL